MDHEQKKAFENTSSSYLSLKAELLRKKQDVQKASSSSSSISSSMILESLQSTSSSLKLKAKADLDVEVSNPSKKKKKADARRSPTPPPVSALSRADEAAFAKSRAILEAKSKLYDEIMSNSEMKLMAEDDGDEDNEKSFLVDFERKIYETNAASQKVEYVDSFGRTRLVTAEEYERMRAAERKYSAETVSTKKAENEIERVERLHREQMRSKWEAEMEELRNKTDVHYQDVLFDEKRDHGVGYYKFSTDEQRRAEQMATLNQLRSHTKEEQAKFHEGQDKRQSAMAERLNKIRLRKAKEMGIQLEDHNPTERTPTPSEVSDSDVVLLSRSMLPSFHRNQQGKTKTHLKLTSQSAASQQRSINRKQQCFQKWRRNPHQRSVRPFLLTGKYVFLCRFLPPLVSNQSSLW